MYRGTTPTFTFTLSVDTSVLSEIWFTFSQDREELLTRDMSECDLDGTTITFTMNQNETLLFHDGTVEMQVRALFTDGTAGASEIVKMQASRILRGGVIS
ncbi:MAG: hypothetical protein WCS15_11685 [Prevotella sp.]